MSVLHGAPDPFDSLLRPRRLRPGDAVAVVSPSWGGPGTFPHIADAGVAALRAWGLEVREYPSTRAPAEVLAADHALRARDLNAAFADPSIRAVMASIGGDDSIRLLPLLDRAAVRADPKIVLGYSDTTTLLAAVRRLGVVAFHGPAVMAGLAQLGAWPAAVAEHVRTMLFEPAATYRYPAFGIVTEGYPDWRDPALAGQVLPARPDEGWRVLQGSGTVEGPLWGGCIEVVDWLRGTWAWPPPGGLRGALLCLEPSEEKPGPDAVARMVRSMAAIGVLDEVAGVLLGRPRDHTPDEAAAFEAAVTGVVAGELGRRDLPLVANVSFGHTDPQWVLPLGVRAAADLDAGTLTLVEPWLA